MGDGLSRRGGDPSNQAELLSDLRVDPRERFPGSPIGICATGCLGGATFYATQHNAKQGYEPILIEFEAPDSEVYVDGRDFLYTAFQIWDRSGADHQDQQYAAIAQVFGRRCAELFLLATREIEPMRRINLATIAVTDGQVVREHHANITPLQGRYKTLFCSAFIVRGPVPAHRILSVTTPDPGNVARPVLHLDDFLGQKQFLAAP